MLRYATVSFSAMECIVMRFVQRKYAFWKLYGALIAFFYAGIAVLTTWDLAPKLPHTWIVPKDTLVHFWNNWWIRYPYRTAKPLPVHMMFTPAGLVSSHITMPV